MNLLHPKEKFMTGLNYLDCLQYGNRGDRLMINRRHEFSKTLYSKDLFAHYGCVNAIEFSNNGEWLVSGGDDKRVLLWNVDKNLAGVNQPKAMKGDHNSNIFCLGFSHSHSRLFSAGNDEQVILHDVATGETLDVFLHSEAVYGLSVDPVNESVFATACDSGSLLVWDIRSASNEPFTLSKRISSYHAVMYNPVEPRYLVSANAHDGVCLWDIRKPRLHIMKYGPNVLFQSAMSVRFNAMGTHLLALRRRFPPVLYEVTSSQPVAEFDHQEYYNSCTMKSCSFAGDKDQYVLSGSDDFKLYVWKIPDSVSSKKGIWVNKAHFVLRGHRSIVNQVRYNNTYGIFASSGVEKIVKLWSSFPLVYREDHSHYISSKDSLRKVFSPSEFEDIFRESGQFMTHDYSHHSMQEDPRMLAFFDSLVQRDIESWNDPKAKEKFAVFQGLEFMSSSNPSTSDDDLDQVVRSDEENDEMTTHTERSSQQLSLSLSYITKRALANNQADVALRTSEELDPSLDRIAILISQKRREEMLKALKSIQKCDLQDSKAVLAPERHIDYSKNDASERNQTSHDNAFPECERKDKRKYWRKRRAKFNRDSVFGESSSSSSDTDVYNATPSNLNSLLNPVNDSPCNSLSTSEDICSAAQSEIPPSNNSSEEKTSNLENCPSSNLENCPSSNLNGSGTSYQSHESNNCTYFPIKGGKRVKRNYRQRSSEDFDNDE